jgi:hypothetical protein
MAGFLRVNRKGEAAVTRTTDNQCREVGHMRYLYHVSAAVPDTKVDKQGFVIDHVEMSEIAEMGVAPGGSCEQIARRIGEAMVKRLSGKAWVYVRIEPVIDNGRPQSWTEWNSDMDFEVSKLQPE